MMSKAGALRKLKRYNEAMQVYKAIVTNHPLYSGVEGAREGIDEMILLKRLEEDPADVEAYLLLGNIAFRNGHYEEALERFVAVKRLDPDLSEVDDKIILSILQLRSLNLFLARKALDSGEPKSARTILERIPRLTPGLDKEIEDLLKKTDSMILYGK